MEQKMETAIMDYMRTTTRIHSFIPKASNYILPGELWQYKVRPDVVISGVGIAGIGIFKHWG